MKKPIFLLAILMLFALTACSAPTNNTKEQQQVLDQQGIYVKNQPVHTYQFSAERALLQQLYDLRVKGDLNTWTVVVSNSGVPLFSCPSKGFPLPYGSELTNPNQATNQVLSPGGSWSSSGVTTVGQMDPNGIYPTPSALGTWIMCIDEKGAIHPQYAEPLVLAFTYPVAIKDGKIVITGNATATLDATAK